MSDYLVYPPFWYSNEKTIVRGSKVPGLFLVLKKIIKMSNLKQCFVCSFLRTLSSLILYTFSGNIVSWWIRTISYAFLIVSFNIAMIEFEFTLTVDYSNGRFLPLSGDIVGRLHVSCLFIISTRLVSLYLCYFILLYVCYSILLWIYGYRL